MNIKPSIADVGVIIGRFQVHKLHKGHKALIESVLKNHRSVAILIGSTPGVLVTRLNPLDYPTREAMIKEEYPGIITLPIKDKPCDKAWSLSVDERISEIFEGRSVILYGSRDAFIPHYHGRFPVVELEDTHDNITGTSVRKMVSKEVRASHEFRRGAIYAAFRRFPATFPTVDIAIVNPFPTPAEACLLLGRKHSDPPDRWRFPGGFVDPKLDNSLEEAATREAVEEVGQIGISKPKYIASLHIDDWRYAKEVDQVITSLWFCQYSFGAPKAGDDLDQVKWLNIEEIGKDPSQVIILEHIKLFEKLVPYLREEY